MVQTGILDTFIPKEWAEANGTTADAYEGYLPLPTLNKVFMYNNTGDKTYDKRLGTSWRLTPTACSWISTASSSARTSCTC